MAVVKIRDVLRLLRMEPGTITVCTYDERRKTGGKRLEYKNCMLTGLDEEPGKAQVKEDTSDAVNRVSKKPNFRVNRTTNIRCNNGDTVTIHPILIETFNGNRVTP